MSIDENCVANDAIRTGDPESHGQHAWQSAAAKVELDAAKRYRDLVRFSLELAKPRVEVGDDSGRGEVCEGVSLKVGDLGSGIEEHPVVGGPDPRGEDGYAHELVEVHALPGVS